MTGLALETVRKRQGVSQVQAAKLLGLSQPMLSHMETGKRNVSLEVAQRAAELFGGDPTALPLDPLPRHSDKTLASELGMLGYPGYAHLSGRLRNPAEFLLDALDHSDLDVRTTEGLPWVVLRVSPSRLVMASQRSKAKEPPEPARLRHITSEQDGASKRPSCCVECLRARVAGTRGCTAREGRHTVPRLVASVSQATCPSSEVEACCALEPGYPTLGGGPCTLRCLSLGCHS